MTTIVGGSWAPMQMLSDDDDFGRTLTAFGAPLSGGQEHSTPAFSATDSTGRPLIGANAHLRLVEPSRSGADLVIDD